MPADRNGGDVSGTGEWVQQVPLQVVPEHVTVSIADLGFAGRYLPAGLGTEPIAGDFYDLLALTPDLVAIVVGDVSGHGPDALARMQQLRAAARAYAIETPGPASVIARLDRFCARLDPESLATLWYGEYQPSTGMLSYAGAGHPPPVVASPDGVARLLAPSDAPPLGVGTAGAGVTVHRERLPVGAVLVVYTDGLVERHDVDFEFQLAVLQEVVVAASHPTKLGEASEIAGRILDVLIPSPESAEDDVCLLVIRREPRVISLEP
jgi:serine phosphatase RsbU (regulator of sigma subunit)